MVLLMVVSMPSGDDDDMVMVMVVGVAVLGLMVAELVCIVAMVPVPGW